MRNLVNTLSKSDVTRRDHVFVVMDPMNAGSRHSQFHSRRHSLRITLIYTTLVHKQWLRVNHEIMTTERVTFGL